MPKLLLFSVASPMQFWIIGIAIVVGVSAWIAWNERRVARARREAPDERGRWPRLMWAAMLAALPTMTFFVVDIFISGYYCDIWWWLPECWGGR